MQNRQLRVRRGRDTSIARMTSSMRGRCERANTAHHHQRRRGGGGGGGGGGRARGSRWRSSRRMRMVAHKRVRQRDRRGGGGVRCVWSVLIQDRVRLRMGERGGGGSGAGLL